MSQPLSAPLRSLKARLRVLRRPPLWGAAGILLLAIGFLAEYWQNPQQFVGVNPNDPFDERAALTPLDPMLTEEDPALEEAVTEDGTPAPGTDRAAESPRSRDDLEELLAANLLDGSPAETSLLPLAASAEQTDRSLLAQTPALDSPATRRASSDFLAALTGGARSSSELAAAGSDAAIAPEISPLQAALDRLSVDQPLAALTPTTDSAPGNSSTWGDDMWGDRSSSTYSVAQTPASPSATSFPEQTFPLPTYVPRTSPPPGTTGYTLPLSLQTPSSGAASGTYSNGYGSYNYNSYNNGYNNTYNTYGSVTFQPQTQFQPIPGLQPATAIPAVVQPSPAAVPAPAAQVPVTPAPAPFSVPRAIGNGRINTFGNP